MMQLSVDEVLRLSPDEASAKAAKGLVVPGKWASLAFSDAAVWGECKGSGAKPYQVQVDLAEPAFRCSCPSRKFPCKHGLALLLLKAQHPNNFSPADPPAWVSDWLASRKQRADKQEQKQTEAVTKPAMAADPQASSRREAQRQSRMQAGLDDLDRWLADRVRQGLAQLPAHPDIWNEMATRMIDAQLPGMAFRLRRIGTWIGKDETWPARVLGGLGQLHVLIDAYRRLDTLPQATQTDIHTALGVALDREAVLASGERVNDGWLVLGQHIDEDSRLWARRVWLQGAHSGRRALLLDYAHGARQFEQVYVPATSLQMTLVFFPGNASLRALPLDDRTPSTALDDGARSTAPASPPSVLLNDALDTTSRQLAANPWQWPQPLLLGDGVPGRDASGWTLQTAAHRLKLSLHDDDGWRLLAESGGAPLILFGEWDGDSLRPLSAWGSRLVWVDEGAAR